MNFRRQPFQFTAIDPAKRQAELQKRFGLPSSNSNMYVDYLNPGLMGSGTKEPSLTSGSPRLQHRVPIFTENADKNNSEHNNVDGGHKPRVRVVPIKVEGVDGERRHRTFSGPAGMVEGSNDLSKGRLQETFPHLDSTKVEDQIKKTSQPRVCNIPIKIEPREEKSKVEPSLKTPEPSKKLKTESNGCAASKEQKVKSDKTVPFKQIDNVLNKLEKYKEEVDKFSGTSKDKQYRYLDEMLTRCMLDLDNVDTMGLDEIRKARKEAVRQVQHYVDLLDTKVNAVVEKMESDSSSIDNPIEESKDGEMSDIPTEESKDREMACDIPAEANNTASTIVNELVESNYRCTTEDVEMNDEKVVGDHVLEVTNEKMEMFGQGGEPMDSAVTEPSSAQEDADKSPKLNMAPTSCTEPDSEMKECDNKPEIIIEELDNSLENESNVSASEVGENENVICIVSHSPELDVKEPIAEEGDSDILIEEVKDTICENLNAEFIDHSTDIFDSSVNKQDIEEKLTIEQLNIEGDSCGVTSTNVSSHNNSVVQEAAESEK